MDIEALTARVLELEARQYAMRVLLTQVAAFLPAPYVLLGHLAEDSATHLLFQQIPEEFLEEANRELKRLYAMLLDMRRGIAEADLRQIPE